jgi:septal ring factor EnvC (AmiA/AmiB activator)
MTLTGVVDTMSKHVLKTNETLESVKGSMNLMPDKTELQRIRETMDELLEEVRALREENKTHYTLTAKRLETVEAAVPPLQAKLSDLVDKQNAPPAPPAPRTKREAREQIAAAQNNVVGGAASKSQARHNTDPKGVHKAPPALPIGDDPRMDYLDEVETPATKPETLENPPTDSTPKAG